MDLHLWARTYPVPSFKEVEIKEASSFDSDTQKATATTIRRQEFLVLFPVMATTVG